MKYLLLNQLGTPSDPSPQSVGRYLSEFLMDKNVLPLPRPFRDILVKIGIVPRRRYASAAKYQKIWMPQGSPLAVHTENLAKQIQTKLGSEWRVVIGMRYGKPSLQSALQEIPPQAEFVFVPLYPHHARATVGSAIEKMQSLNQKNPRRVYTVEPFYNHDWYIRAQGEKIRQHLAADEHLLLSYHGLPLTQNIHNGHSYEEQCLETMRKLREYLGLPADKISYGFQSRVGVQKWLGPSTEEMILKLAANGVKKISVACPSFVADCLETLEEIGMELREQFLSAGGDAFTLIPCLNDNELFVEGICDEITKTLNSSN